MAKLLRRNGTAIGAQITLFAGNQLPFKVSGLGPNRMHLDLKSSDFALKIVPVRVNDRDIEQLLRMEVNDAGIVSRRLIHIDAYVRGTTQKDSNTARLSVEVLPKIDLPDANTEAGILARMLIVENANPEDPRFVSQTEALESMQWMLHVMRNRLKLGARHFAANGAHGVAALIKAPNQVEGFEEYPSIAPRQADLLKTAMSIANDGTHAKNAAYRQFVESAIAVAMGRQFDTDPCSTGLYAWRSEGSDSPGANFQVFRSRGGQDFYTLTKSFLEQLSTRGVKANP
ncbi:hypothetical protein [Cupriavidus campinensis]